MKATDLMVGDLFKAVDYNSPFRITAIYDDVVQTQADYQSEIDGNWYSEAEIKDLIPIPLTEEILAKNGYTIDERGTRELSSVFSSNIKLYSFPLGVGFYLEYDTEKSACHLTDHCLIEIKYVHELQHLLRMCGIEKEIELW